jgi:hypothetical protein
MIFPESLQFMHFMQRMHKRVQGKVVPVLVEISCWQQVCEVETQLHVFQPQYYRKMSSQIYVLATLLPSIHSQPSHGSKRKIPFPTRNKILVI